MDDVTAELAVTSEELRVADEELRAQQELIDTLVQGRLAEHLASSRLVSAMPVPIVDTDRAGTVLQANPAAAALLRVDSGRLRGKPLLAFVEPADRRALRTALTQAPAWEDRAHHAVLLTPRRQQAVRVTIALVPTGATTRSAEDGPAPTVRWVLNPQATTDSDALDALAELSTLPVVTGDLRTVLERTAALAVRGIGPAATASVVVGPPAEPRLLASTDELAQALDGVQFRAGDGPTWDAYDTAATVAGTDLQADERWPDLDGPMPGDLCGAVAAPMLDGTVPVGVLTVYGPPTIASGEHAGRVGLFATAAAAVVREHQAVADLRRIEAQLRDALTSRATIDQAKGILMALHGGDADAAFKELTRRSQAANVKLREVARQLVEQVSRSAEPAHRPTVVPSARPSTPARSAGTRPRPGPRA